MSSANAIDITIFGIDISINPIAFTIPIGDSHWNVYWYGIIIAIGFLMALIYGLKNANRFNLDPDRMLDVVIVTVPVAILCARVYYLIFDGQPLNSIADFFGLGTSSGFAGLAIYGGVIGAFTTGALMCKIRKIKILDMFDIAAIGFLIGQGIGRWGNFVNQEAYGSFTNSSWWGMQSDRTIREMGEGLVHPCFLYESVWCIAGFFLLNYFSKRRKFSGQLILMYCTWYGLGRGFIELLRTDSLMIGTYRVSALLSFLFCISSSIALISILTSLKRNAAKGNYSELFSDNTADTAEEQPDGATAEIYGVENACENQDDEENDLTKQQDAIGGTDDGQNN